MLHRWPDARDVNGMSFVPPIGCSDVSFPFAGDAEYMREHTMIDAGWDLKAGVLKLGHPGVFLPVSGSLLTLRIQSMPSSPAERINMAILQKRFRIDRRSAWY